jgi:hypothetical protein
MSDFITTETDVAAFLMSKEHELRDIRVVDDQCSLIFSPEAAATRRSLPARDSRRRPDLRPAAICTARAHRRGQSQGQASVLADLENFLHSHPAAH